MIQFSFESLWCEFKRAEKQVLHGEMLDTMKVAEANGDEGMFKVRGLVVAAGLACGLVSQGHSLELLSNGGFESNDFTGWEHLYWDGSSVQSGSGTQNAFFEVDSDISPTFGDDSAQASSEGTFFAVSNYQGDGATLLSQNFSLAALGVGDTVTVSYDMFVDNNTGQPTAIHADGLDPSVFFGNNIHARVDLLDTADYLSDQFTTSGVDILQNFYLGADGGVDNPYTSYLFDITSLVSGGGNFTLRFANVSNQSHIAQGIDDIRVSLTPAAVPTPEPMTLALFASGLLGLARIRQTTVAVARKT